MNKVVLCVFLYFAVALVVAQKGVCQNQMKAFVSCVEKKFKDNKAADELKKTEIKDKISKCFTDARCEEPDYDSEPKIGGIGGIAKQAQNMPPEVKECLKKEMKTKVTEVLNKCLKSKNIKPLVGTEAEDNDLFDEKRMGGDEEEREKMKKTVMNIGLALKKCNEDNGEEASDKVRTCIKPVHDEIRKHICTRINDCKKEKVTDEACKKRSKEITDASCQCKKDKLKAALKKVEELQKRQKDVEMEEVKEIMEDDMGKMEDNLEKVEKCYKDNKQQVPPFFAILKAGSQGGLLSLFKPKISQEQLEDIHDMLQQKLDEPCGCN